MRLRLTLAVGIALLVAPAAQAAPAWLAPAQIPGSAVPDREVKLAFGADGTLVAVWHEGSGSTQTVKTATRPPGGPFGPVDTLGGPASGLGAPRVAVDGQGTVLVAWSQGSGARYSTRPPGGAFSGSLDLPRPVGENVNSAVEVAFNAQGEAVAAWVGSTVGPSGADYHLRASVRPPGGTLGAPVSLDNGLSNPDTPGSPSYSLNSVNAAAAGNDLIASWQRSCCSVGTEAKTVRVAVRPPGGPFGSTQTLDTASGLSEDVSSPRLAGNAQGSAIIVWGKTSGSSGNVAACTRPPGGSFVGCTIENVSGTGTAPRSPNVGLDGQGNPVAAWSRPAPGAADPHVIQTAGRAAGVSSWTPLGTFSESGTSLIHPVLAASAQGAAILAWEHGTRLDGAARAAGSAFGASQPLSTGGADALFPAAAMDPSGNGAAAWERGTQPDAVIDLAGFDGAGPRLAGLSIPGAGDTGQPLSFAVSASDVWSAVQSIDWKFGDGSAASGAQVTHTYARVGGSFTVGLSAADSLGNATTASGLTVIRDTARPLLTRLRMARRRFAVGRARTPLVAKRVPHGSAFRFRLSEPATVKIRIERKRRARHGSRYLRVATLTRRGRRLGSNRVGFSGRIKRRALPPGVYRATLRAVDPAGNRSRARRTSFTIVRPN